MSRQLRFSSALAALAVALVVLTQAGCGSSVTKANYDKIKEGMTQKEVEAILGPGKVQGSSSASLPLAVPGIGDTFSASGVTWQEGSKTIVVSFANDKVVGKVSSGL